MASSTPGPSSSSSSSFPIADPARPTIFELLASSQLESLLSPAVRYALSVLAQRNPRVFLRAFNSFDELWALLMLAVERHYLRVWGSSFSENFYGLRRRRRVGLGSASGSGSRSSGSGGGRAPRAGEEALSATQINAGLFFLVGMPYLQRKLHDWWELNGGGVDELEDLFDDDGGAAVAAGDDAEASGHGTFTGNFDQHDNEKPAALPLRARLRKHYARLLATLRSALLKSYPYLSSSWSLWILSYHVRYLFSHTPYWRPWLALLRVEVRRVAPGDYDAAPGLASMLSKLPSPLAHPAEFIARLSRAGPYAFFESLKYALPASIFLFKFVEWWYSPDNPRRRGGAGGGAGSSSPLGRFGPPKIILPSRKGVAYKKVEGVWKDPGITVVPDQSVYDGADGDEEGGEDYEVAPGPALVHNSCPLCGATPMNNPAVLPTGYAFCYTCVNAYVEKEGRCPVTRQKLLEGTEGVRRVLG